VPEKGRHGLHRRLAERFGDRAGEAAYAFFACGLALGTSGLAAYLAKQPLLFPSLGPTALLFFERPMAATSSPRNALIGHAVAILAGALSLALTGTVLLLLDASHPPTGATTLIVSLGFLQTPPEMAALMAGVVLLTVVGWLLNRAAGVPMPVWGAAEGPRAPG
jgi:CBS domain-containing membrane protein